MPALPYPAVRKSVQEAHRVEFTREVKYKKTPVQGRLPRVAQVSPEMDSGGPCRESTASGFCSKWFEMVRKHGRRALALLATRSPVELARAKPKRNSRSNSVDLRHEIRERTAVE